MGNCVICNKILYGSGICDTCKTLADKIKELRSKKREWFEELFDRNSDCCDVPESIYDFDEVKNTMSKEVFVSLMMDLLV